MIFPLDSANGIGLSPDDWTLYVANTYTSHLWRFSLASTGVLGGTGSIVGRGGPGQYFDSLAVDADGRICVASPGDSAILVFDPAGGAPETVATPDFLTNNICFGEPDMRSAWITLGSSGRLARMSWPAAGLRLAY